MILLTQISFLKNRRSDISGYLMLFPLCTQGLPLPLQHHNFAMSRVQQAQHAPCAVGDLSLGVMGHPLRQRNSKVQQRGGGNE